MIQIVPFHINEPFRHENCVVIRNYNENIEFGFPYFDALPVKLPVSQCMNLISFIKACVNHLDDGQAINLSLRPVDSKVDEVIIVRKTFADSLHIDFAFADIGPIMINIDEVVNFSETLNKMLDIKLINAPE